jgi:hypothetical protein
MLCACSITCGQFRDGCSQVTPHCSSRTRPQAHMILLDWLASPSFQVFAVGSWYHVACTYAAPTLTMYVNGVVAGSTNYVFPEGKLQHVSAWPPACPVSVRRAVCWPVDSLAEVLPMCRSLTHLLGLYVHCMMMQGDGQPLGIGNRPGSTSRLGQFATDSVNALVDDVAVSSLVLHHAPHDPLTCSVPLSHLSGIEPHKCMPGV